MPIAQPIVNVPAVAEAAEAVGSPSLYQMFEAQIDVLLLVAMLALAVAAILNRRGVDGNRLALAQLAHMPVRVIQLGSSSGTYTHGDASMANLATLIEPAKTGAETFYSGRRGVSLTLDRDAFDFHITTMAARHKGEHAEIINLADALGYELMDEDECPSVRHADGSITTYLVPSEPVEV